MYDTFEVAVPGGTLHVGRWGDGPTTVIAAHGLTANHQEFAAVADALGDDFSLVAPDLRGRGGSNGVQGPFGMSAHADDLVAVLDQLGVESAVLAGHSMGGFVAVVAAHSHPERTSGLVLIDGGLPPSAASALEGLPVEDAVRAVVGPSLDRLRMTFESVDAYFAFWRDHPALADDWNDYIENYLRADLTGEAPALRPAASEVAVLGDAGHVLDRALIADAVQDLHKPVAFLRAPRGVFNETPPLFTEETIEEWQQVVPQLRHLTVPDVNHFTITLAERGAKVVADVIRDSTN